MSRNITPLQLFDIDAEGNIAGQYSTETYAPTVVTGNVEKSGTLELPATHASETLDDTIGKIKTYLDNLGYVATEQRQVIDEPEDNSSNLASTKATASLKASLDALTAIVTQNKADIATKAPIDHSNAEKTYGGATKTLYGHVKTTDKYIYNGDGESAPTEADSVAASPKAVADAYSALDAAKAPVDHATTDTTYGSATLLKYGHVKVSDTYKVAEENGDAAHGVVVSQKALNDMYKDVQENQETGVASRAPIMHASADRTYGVGTGSTFGHLKISDDYDMANVETTGNAASGMAASLFALHRSNAALQAVVNTKLAATHANEHATAAAYSHVKLTDTYNASQGSAADGVGASSKALADAFANLNGSITAAQNSIVTLNSDITNNTNTIINAISGVNDHITNEGTNIENYIASRGTVKSIQRMMGSFGAAAIVTTRNINPVNVDKSIILVHSSCTAVGGLVESGFSGNSAVNFYTTGVANAAGVTLYFEATVVEFY